MLCYAKLQSLDTVQGETLILRNMALRILNILVLKFVFKRVLSCVRQRFTVKSSVLIALFLSVAFAGNIAAQIDQAMTESEPLNRKKLTLYIPTVSIEGAWISDELLDADEAMLFADKLEEKFNLDVSLNIGEWNSVFPAFENDPQGIILPMSGDVGLPESFYMEQISFRPYMYKTFTRDDAINSLSLLGERRLGALEDSLAESFLSKRVLPSQLRLFHSVSELHFAFVTQNVDVVLSNVDPLNVHLAELFKQSVSSNIAEDIPMVAHQQFIVGHKSAPLVENVIGTLQMMLRERASRQPLATYDSLSPETYAWLKENKVLRLCIPMDADLFSTGGSDRESIFASFTHLIAQRLHLAVKFIPIESLDEISNALGNNLCDASYIATVGDIDPLKFSKPFMQFHLDYIASRAFVEAQNSNDQSKQTILLPNILRQSFGVNVPEGIAVSFQDYKTSFEQLINNESVATLLWRPFFEKNKEALKAKGVLPAGIAGEHVAIRMVANQPALIALVNSLLVSENLNDMKSYAESLAFAKHNTVYLVSDFDYRLLFAIGLGFGLVIILMSFYIQRVRRADAAHENALNMSRKFLANMSHEIRTPMNAIVGMSELLSIDDSLGELSKEQVEVIQRSSQQMMRLLNDILDSSKIEAGEIALEYIPVDVKRMMGDVFLQWHTLAEEKGLKLICPRQFEVSSHWRMVDPTRLNQVLSNLITNAIKFTDEGEVSLDVIELEDDYLLFRVEDSGIGITKEKHVQIFNRFEQADTSTTRKYGGTGLGLSICQSLIELMGGKISLKSEPNKGSTFEFRLPLEMTSSPLAEGSDVHIFKTSKPLVSDDALLSDQASSSVEKSNMAESVGCVLLVDDIDVNRFVLKMIISKNLPSIEVLEADSVSAAIGVLEKRTVNVVLTDINMPEATGKDLLDAIRSGSVNSVSRSLPVVAVTGDDNDESLKAMFNAVMYKPVSIDQLISILNRLGVIESFKTITDDAVTQSAPSSFVQEEGFKQFFVDLAKQSDNSDWQETVLTPCVSIMELLLDDMRVALARQNMTLIHNLALHFNTLGTLMGDPEIKVIARRMLSGDGLSTQLVMECYLAFGFRLKDHKRRVNASKNRFES